MFNAATAFLKRKVFFAPLLYFKSDDPNFTNLETYLDEILNRKDEVSLNQKKAFFNNLNKLYKSYANAGNIDLRIQMILFMPFWILGGCFFIWLFFSEVFPNAERGGFYTLLLTFIILRPIYVVYNFFKGFYEIKKIEKRMLSTMVSMQQNEYPHVWKPVIDFSDAINLDIKRIKIYYLKENHFVPTVTDLKRIGTKLVVITIPRNLLVLSKKDPELYEAIMSHEMSHVEQGDSGIWMNFYLDQRCAYSFQDLILNLIIGKEKRLIKKYKTFNSSAEYLADLGSFIFTGSTKIFDFLNGGYISEQEGDFHPGIEKRIQFLKAILYQQAKLVFK